MTNKMSKNAYSLTVSAVLMSMGMMATSQAMAAQDSAPPPLEPPVAVAADAAPSTASTPSPGSFEAMDANADGGLVNDEIPADHPLNKKFKKADADKNGQLSKQEFDAYQSKNVKSS
ncbi:MAG: hypothetical protein ACREO1_13945 [Arenimonas sp.]